MIQERIEIKVKLQPEMLVPFLAINSELPGLEIEVVNQENSVVAYEEIIQPKEELSVRMKRVVCGLTGDTKLTNLHLWDYAEESKPRPKAWKDFCGSLNADEKRYISYTLSRLNVPEPYGLGLDATLDHVRL